MGQRRKPLFRKTVLENGLTLLTEQTSQYRSLSIGVWVRVGTRHERAAESGASHFLEHMLFKGTRARSALDLAREVDRVGGEFNAFTAREYTCFHLLLLDRDASLGVDILSDVLLNSEFASVEFERERKVILQEIAMVEESPEEMIHDLYFEKVYGEHGLGKPILGTAESIGKMRRADLLDYFRAYYRPENLVIAVSGDASHSAIEKRLGSLARRSWPSRKAGSRACAPAWSSVPKVESGRWWVVRPTEQVHLLWGVEGPRYDSADRFAAYLLNVYLGGGMSSALFQEIREKKGLAYTVYSSLTPFTDSGMFTVYAATGMDRVPTCLRLIEESVRRLKEKPLPRSELQIIKDNLKGTILLSSDSVEARMSSIARNEIYFRRYVAVDEVCRAIDRVAAADIQRVACQLFASSDRSLMALGPKPSRALLRQFSNL